MADETMFARLVAAVQRDVERQVSDKAVQERLMAPSGPSSSDLLFLGRDDHDGSDYVSVPAIVRALLAELRTALGEAKPGYIAMPGTLTAAQRDTLKQEWSRLANSALAGMIDAILAEAGGSRGA